MDKLIRLFRLYNVFFVILVISYFGSEGRIWALIAKVSVHCLLVFLFIN